VSGFIRLSELFFALSREEKGPEGPCSVNERERKERKGKREGRRELHALVLTQATLWRLKPCKLAGHKKGIAYRMVEVLVCIPLCHYVCM